MQTSFHPEPYRSSAIHCGAYRRRPNWTEKRRKSYGMSLFCHLVAEIAFFGHFRRHSRKHPKESGLFRKVHKESKKSAEKSFYFTSGRESLIIMVTFAVCKQFQTTCSCWTCRAFTTRTIYYYEKP